MLPLSYFLSGHRIVQDLVSNHTVVEKQHPGPPDSHRGIPPRLLDKTRPYPKRHRGPCPMCERQYCQCILYRVLPNLKCCKIDTQVSNHTVVENNLPGYPSTLPGLGQAIPHATRRPSCTLRSLQSHWRGIYVHLGHPSAPPGLDQAISHATRRPVPSGEKHQLLTPWPGQLAQCYPYPIFFLGTALSKTQSPITLSWRNRLPDHPSKLPGLGQARPCHTRSAVTGRYESLVRFERGSHTPALLGHLSRLYQRRDTHVCGRAQV